VASRYREDDLEGVADAMATAMVEGYFPEQETQLALEQQTFERAVVVYRYNRFETVLNGWGDSPSDLDYVLSDDLYSTLTEPLYVDRMTADASGANDRVQENLAAGIEAGLEEEYGSDPDLTGDELADEISTGNVTVTVRTWDQ